MSNITLGAKNGLKARNEISNYEILETKFALKITLGNSPDFLPVLYKVVGASAFLL